MKLTSPQAIRRVVIISATLIYLVVGLFAYNRLSRPSDGTRLWLHPQMTTPGSITAVPLTLQSTNLLPGDKVIAIEGKPITDWANELFNYSVEKPNWNFGDRVTYTVMRNNQLFDVRVLLQPYPIGQIVWKNMATVIFLGMTQISSIWLFVRRPDERTSQTLFLASVCLTAFGICWFLGSDLISFVSVGSMWPFYRILTFVLLLIMCASLLHFTLLIPGLENKQGLEWWMVRLIYTAPYPAYLLFLILSYTPDTLEWIRRWEHGIWMLMTACVITGLVIIRTRYWNLPSSLSQKRLRIVTIAMLATILLAIVAGWLPMWMSRETGANWETIPLAMIPVTIGLVIAALFYRLFDVRIVIQRTIVWSALTAMIIGVYIAVVGTLSVLFDQQDNPVLSMVATGIAAILFQPVRERLQRTVNTLIYGDRDSPYDVIISLTKRLEEALVPQVALKMIVETIGNALHLPYTAIELMENEHYVVAAEYGSQATIPIEKCLYFPLKYEKGTIGRLIIAPYPSGETLSRQDHRLISGLIHEAEVTIQTAHLTVDLQRSREKIVFARAEERRRIRRDLHDGLGPALASLMLQVDAARNLLHQDITKSEHLLLELKKQIQSAIADVRRLVYELQPPILDELGLIAALEEKARQLEQSAEMVITVEADSLPPLPAAVESALYRIALEALTNTVRHAKATRCSIRLKLNGDLRLEITDNGKGMPTKPHYGIGIRSMQERADELGGTCTIDSVPQGGLQVIAKLPIRSLTIPQQDTKGT